MNAGSPHAAIRSVLHTAPQSKPFELSSMPPRLVTRADPDSSAVAPRRTKIWEFNTNLHCSIIGTCLSTGELRQVLKNLGMARQAQGCTDHELHGIAVSLAGRHDDAARQLNKALDRRHKLAVTQFAKANAEDAVRSLWREAVRRAEIPGAYWATLTHPCSTQAVIREAFGEVHMLSHLVGSANRADLRRLCQLEADRAELQAKLERQQIALHQAVVNRDNQIKDLRLALAQRLAHEPDESFSQQSAALRGLVADLERQLAAEIRRRTVLDERLSAEKAAVARERSSRLTAERERDATHQELAAVEASLALEETRATAGLRAEVRLDGVTLLYVGGRPNQVAPMRAAVERAGARFLHHDGGLEDHPNLLPGLASRADGVLFPVDCVSHDAANAVKSLCRQAGKRFFPLRSASVTSLLAALQAPEMALLSAAAD